MIRSWLLRALFAIALVLMIALALVTALLATEPGSRWLLAQLSRQLDVQFDYVEGALIRSAHLANVHYHSRGFEVSVQQLELAWRPGSLFWGALYIDRLALTDVAVTAGAHRNTVEPRSDWPAIALPVKVFVRQFRAANITVNSGQSGPVTVDEIAARFNVGMGRASLDSLRIGVKKSQLSLKGDVDLIFPYAVKAALDVQWRPEDFSDQPVFAGMPVWVAENTWQGSLAIDGDIRHITYSVSTKKPVAMAGAGDFYTGFSRSRQQFDGRIDARVNLAGQPLPKSLLDLGRWQPEAVTAGLHLSGWLSAYRLDGHIEVPWKRQKKLRFTIASAGNRRGLSAEQLALSLGQTAITGRGRLGWEDGIDWQLDLQGRELNPGDFFPGWPGRLQFGLQSQGRWLNRQLALSVQVEEIQGELRSLMLLGSGAAEFAQGQWQFDQLTASLGANQLQLNGVWGDKVDVKGHINAPILAQIDPALAGQFMATGRLQGEFPRLHFIGEARAEDLRWQDYAVGSMRWQSRVDDVTSRQVSVQAEARDLDLKGRVLQSLAVSAEGEPAAHRLALQLVRDSNYSGQASLAGGWQNGQWAGSIESLRFSLPYGHEFALKAPAAVAWSAQQARLEQLCLSRLTGVVSEPQDSVCVRGDWKSRELYGQVEVKRLSLSLLDPWLQEDMSLAGYLTGAGQLRRSGQLTQLQAGFTSAGSEIIHTINDTEVERYPFGEMTLDLSGQGQTVYAEALASLQDAGRVHARGSYQIDSGQVEAQLNASLQHLRPLMAFIPGVDHLTGELVVAANLTGPASRPELSVSADLNRASVELLPLGITLNALQAHLQGDQYRMQLYAESGEGELVLNASAEDLMTDNWQLELDLSGEGAQLINRPELSLWVVPKIAVSADPQAIAVQGEARIPKARVVIDTLPTSAVKLSPDVVVADEPEKVPDRWPLTMDLQLILGKDVEVQASGFSAGLGGRLSLNKIPERALYATGDILVTDGQYNAFGQQLSVEKGRLSFQGPLDNPGLDITATRSVEDVSVGLIIGGSLQKPVTEIYSRPTLSETNAMSLLFTGKRLDSASTDEAAMLINTVAKLGIKQGQFLADDIAKAFGLDELTIKAEESVESSQLWLGKYLTRDIYIHYAIGLFDSISTVGLTYFISDNFYIEAESGVEQSADIIYRVEK